MELNSLEAICFAEELDKTRNRIKNVNAELLLKAKLLDALNEYISELCDKFGIE